MFSPSDARVGLVRRTELLHLFFCASDDKYREKNIAHRIIITQAVLFVRLFFVFFSLNIAIRQTGQTTSAAGKEHI